MSRSLVSSRIIRYGVGRSVSWPGRTFTWQTFLVEYMWWLDQSRLYVLFADIWVAQKEISREVIPTGSPHPVVEADDRPLLNITLSKQALPRPWDAALANLPIHKLINYFEAKGAAQLCFWGREKNQLFKNYASPAQRSARKDLQGRGSWGMAACLRGFWVSDCLTNMVESVFFTIRVERVTLI